MNLKQILQNDVLPRVERPSRYLGIEHNAVHKSPDSVDLRIALAFPDVYDLGLGNLGLLILYALLNERPWCWCERTYAPAPDMEQVLRERNLPLFALESGDSLDALDVIGFTMQSELTYTNILNMLDVGGVPVRSADRAESDPIVLAGGPTACNPEPMAPFIDAFLIGDGEEAIIEIAECLRLSKGRPRLERLETLSAIDGVYVPALFPLETLSDGRVMPRCDGPLIRKRVVEDLDAASFPTRYIVPYTPMIHDRVSLEVLRGCTQGCRFCQAGMTSRPVRERSLETLASLMDEALDNTGYEELSLVSLSTCDYSQASDLVHNATQTAAARNVSVSLPSLRLDTFAVELADQVTGVRRSGLTVAPEAASSRLRSVINKPIPDEDLIAMACEAFRRGWAHIKTYFMIGLPTETDNDIEAIVDLCARTLEAGKTITPKARIHTGVSTFVPKPFTPFQWAAQISPDEVVRRQDILRNGFARVPGVKFGRHGVQSTVIEGLLSRGDRRMADIIEDAWRRGARLDTWDDKLRFDAWQGAIKAAGIDVDDVFQERPLDARFPWDHIDMGVSKDWLRAEWEKALALQDTPDCRHATCHQCGVSTSERPLCDPIRRKMLETEEVETLPLPPSPSHEEPPAAQRLRLRIGRYGETRFLGHLELAAAWARALRRAGAPLSYTQGFHAHPRINFSSAAPLGEESEGDYMDVVLKECVEPQRLVERLRAVLPPGLIAHDIEETPIKAPSLMSLASGFSYDIVGPGDVAEVQARAESMLAAESLPVERPAKEKKRKGRRPGRPRTVDVRPMLAQLEVVPQGSDAVRVRLETRMVEHRGVKPREVIALLGLDPAAVRVRKTNTLLAPTHAPTP